MNTEQTSENIYMYIKYQSRIIDKTRHISRGTCLGCLPPLGKSSAFLGKGWVESTW